MTSAVREALADALLRAEAAEARLAQADENAAALAEEVERLRAHRDAAVRERDHAREALRPFIRDTSPRVHIIGRFEVVDVRVNKSEYDAARAALTEEGTGYGPDAGIEFPDDGGGS